MYKSLFTYQCSCYSKCILVEWLTNSLGYGRTESCIYKRRLLQTYKTPSLYFPSHIPKLYTHLKPLLETVWYHTRTQHVLHWIQNNTSLHRRQGCELVYLYFVAIWWISFFLRKFEQLLHVRNKIIFQ